MDKLSQRGNTHNKCWITKICIHTKVNEKMDTSEKVWNTTTQLIIFLRCSTIDHLIGGFLFWITQKLPHFRVTRVFIDKGGKPPKEGKMPLWSKCVHTHHWNKCVHTHHYRNISTNPPWEWCSEQGAHTHGYGSANLCGQINRQMEVGLKLCWKLQTSP